MLCSEKKLETRCMIRQPLIIPIIYNDGECYQGVEPYSVRYKGYDLTVEEGYVCDGASVPRIAWWFMPPDGLHRAASYLHDRFYDEQGNVGSIHFSRVQCDIMFYDLMVQAGVAPWRAWIAFSFVRMFGQSAWWSQDDPPVTILPIRNAHVARTHRGRNFATRHLYETYH